MNYGFINEKQLSEYISNKDFSEYNPNIQKFLQFTFGNKLFKFIFLISNVSQF